MGIDHVIELLNHPAPGFWCTNNGDKSDKSEYLVPVRHVHNEPLARDRFEELLDSLGRGSGADEIADFYKHHNGASLFTNPRTNEGAIFLLPLGAGAGRQMK